MLRQLGFGFWAIAAITGAQIYTMGFAFVDNIDLFHTGQPLQTGEDLIPEMQQAVNAWEKGITATGGSLVAFRSQMGPANGDLGSLVDFRNTGSSLYLRGGI
jgi:hypothetical protein